MNQAALDFTAPPLAQARAAGQAAQELATARAEREEPDFRARAVAAILERLKQGPASGEALTDYVKASGLTLARNGKELGSYYCRLRKSGAIHVVGPCDRAKGHGTGGGKVYALGAGADA